MLSGKCKQLVHATNAIICEGNKTTKFLETKYGFTVSQSKHLLWIAQTEFSHLSLAILENVTCKIG